MYETDFDLICHFLQIQVLQKEKKNTESHHVVSDSY